MFFPGVGLTPKPLTSELIGGIYTANTPARPERPGEPRGGRGEPRRSPLRGVLLGAPRPPLGPPGASGPVAFIFLDFFEFLDVLEFSDVLEFLDVLDCLDLLDVFDFQISSSE